MWAATAGGSLACGSRLVRNECDGRASCSQAWPRSAASRPSRFRRGSWTRASTATGICAAVAVAACGLGLTTPTTAGEVGTWVRAVAAGLTVYGLSLVVLELAERVSGATVETDFQRGHTALSALWGIGALCLYVVGLARDRRQLRVVGLAMFGRARQLFLRPATQLDHAGVFFRRRRHPPPPDFSSSARSPTTSSLTTQACSRREGACWGARRRRARRRTTRSRRQRRRPRDAHRARRSDATAFVAATGELAIAAMRPVRLPVPRSEAPRRPAGSHRRAARRMPARRLLIRTAALLDCRCSGRHTASGRGC
jgi:hypothetical protein